MVNPDSCKPCLPAGASLRFETNRPGSPFRRFRGVKGFCAQIGFRVPNMVISPFTRRHYVSHIPMDHTAVIKFVETRFIGGGTQLTARVAAQPNLLNFIDFNAVPWKTPPTPPAPVTAASLGFKPVHPGEPGALSLGPHGCVWITRQVGVRKCRSST